MISTPRIRGRKHYFKQNSIFFVNWFNNNKIMLAQELKLTIHNLLNTVNDKDLLTKILNLLLGKEEKVAPNVVAYRIDGEALTSELFETKINEAISRMDAGEYVRHEDLCNENWD